MYHQGVKKNIVPRPLGKKSHLSETDPILNRIFSSRGITENDQLERTLTKLPSPWLLSGMESMVAHLITAIEQQQRISIVADFDADGATSCVVAMKGLNLLGANHVSYVVPNRFEYGYGLTPRRRWPRRPPVGPRPPGRSRQYRCARRRGSGWRRSARA